MDYFRKPDRNEHFGSLSSQKRRYKIWRSIMSVMLCAVMLCTNGMGVLAAEICKGELSSDLKENEYNTEVVDPEAETAVQMESEAVYRLYLTHYFRFTANGKKQHISVEEKIELTETDFENGVCELDRFVYAAEQLTVKEARPVTIQDFDEDREGGARIVYAVEEGWRIVPAGDTQEEGITLREVFNGQLSGYEFVPAEVVRIKMKYQYSNTGGLAGMNVVDPETIEVIPEKQSDGSYKVEWTLPTTAGFRILLNPEPLNRYLVKPPTGNETKTELEAALERGDFNVDIDHGTIYYYQEVADETTHPAYNNQYSTEYNQAWNEARALTTDTYTAVVMGQEIRDAEGPGANALVNPKMEVILTEAQLEKALESETELNITVYYRRNATWYHVNHWVPEELTGTEDLDGLDTAEKNGKTYFCLNQETIQGRVGTMTKARAKTDGIYEELTPTAYSQKLIENAVSIAEGDSKGATTVDIYYEAAEAYRVIFDTNYTYIPRQQVELGANVNFGGVTDPKRTGYTFDGWRYLKKSAVPGPDGQYADADYENVTIGGDGKYILTINEELISKAKLQDTGGVLALHLYPIWKPDTTEVRVILWTENLTQKDDVQAIAEGGDSAYYHEKYADYGKAPVTHRPMLGTNDPHYSNMGSFIIENLPTDSSLLAGGDKKALADEIQAMVDANFKTAMGQADGMDVDHFYTQSDFEIVHETGASVDYSTTTAAADGRTMIYVYFTRNIYELQFHYYGSASPQDNSSDYCIANKTNGYSYAGVDKIFYGDELNFDYKDAAYIGSTAYRNSWLRANVTADKDMPVPQTITIKAKYGADLRDVWPVARAEEWIDTHNDDGHGERAQMISWAVTDGKYRTDAMTAGNSHYGEPTIMGSYAVMGSEIIADEENKDTVHHLIAYWGNRGFSSYRNNHCFEIPDLNIASAGVQKISIYNNSEELKNTLYLVPSDNEVFQKYGFSDLMKVSYEDGRVIYDDPDGNYYAVRGYQNGGTIKYYGVSRRVETVSTNTIAQQNPSARLHMSRANANADHTSQYADNDGAAWKGSVCGTPDNPYDLYFYYNRNRYKITYMVPITNEAAARNEVELGSIELPYGARISQKEYGFALDYQDTNQTQEAGENKYPWATTGASVSVCPDRSEKGTAEWRFKGWGLGPAGVNMQWTTEMAETEFHAENVFALQSNLRLYAIWEQPIYTVTFHLHGGTVTRDQKIEVEVPANTRYSANGSIPRPVRDGYTLSGWYQADENGNVVEVPVAFDFDKVITSDQHVAAVWEAISLEKYSYTVYYVTQTLSEGDKDKVLGTVQIRDDKIIENGGIKYYVLEKNIQEDQQFIVDAMLNLTAKEKSGYFPLQTNKALALKNAGDTYQIIFYYEPIEAGKHMIKFVEAGTEQEKNPVVVKAIQAEADQTVITPAASYVKALTEMGYALVVKNDNGAYTAVKNYNDLTWMDAQGNVKKVDTLSGNQIPHTVVYLVQPISYTIVYENAVDSPSAANAGLQAVTASANTPVNKAGDRNPTRYTVKDTFTIQNPLDVYENGRWYQFSHWSLGKDTTLMQRTDAFTTLTVDKETVGNLTFIANWTEKKELGSLSVSNTVEGDAGDKNKEFSFTITLNNTSINGIFGDISFHNGVATFVLKHGEKVTFEEFPAGMSYTVEESDNEGYTVTKSGETGVIKANEMQIVEFSNYKDSHVKDEGHEEDKSASDANQSGSTSDGPRTSDDMNVSLWLLLMSISCAGMVSLLSLSQKQRKKAGNNK